MKYNKTISLKDGRACLLRNAEGPDAAALLDNFNLTHGETDYLLTYPDENDFDAEKERAFIIEKESSEREIEIVAVVDGRIVGSAGIEAVGGKYKLSHRADFGVGIEKAFWGLGVGRALTEACVECARRARYAQLELSVVGENESAVSLYKSVGFVEYGRNPQGFRSRLAGRQEVVLMRMELD